MCECKASEKCEEKRGRPLGSRSNLSLRIHSPSKGRHRIRAPDSSILDVLDLLLLLPRPCLLACLHVWSKDLQVLVRRGQGACTGWTSQGEPSNFAWSFLHCDWAYQRHDERCCLAWRRRQARKRTAQLVPKLLMEKPPTLSISRSKLSKSFRM